MQLTPKLILPQPRVPFRPHHAGFVLTAGNSLIFSDDEEGLGDQCFLLAATSWVQHNNMLFPKLQDNTESNFFHHIFVTKKKIQKSSSGAI